MTTGQKNAVSLLVSLVLFATFSMVAYSGLFSFIETRFYQPAKIQQIRQKLDGISDCYDSYISSIFQKIETYCESKEFFSYMEQQASDSLVRERTRLTGELFNSIPALSGIRIVDVNGRNVHFSTFSADFLRNSENLRSYRNYLDLKNPLQQPEIPFEKISFSNILSDGKNGEKNDRKYRFFADSECDRLIISLPVYDSYKVLKASAVFYLNSMDFNRELLKTNIVAVSDSSDFLNLADGKSGLYGYVFGLPVAGRQMLENLVLASWQTTGDGPERLASYENGFWVLFSSRKSSFAVISGVYRDEIFAMPYSVRILLLVCAFISLFLVVCLLVSLKHDDLVVIRSRIRRFQFAVVNEYLNDKMEIDWKATAKSIYDRKGEISDSIRRSLGKRRLKKYSREIDELLEKSWNEIFNVLNVRSGAEIAASATEKLKDTVELRQMLEEILSNTSIKVHSIQEPLAHAEAAELAEPADEVEEAEDSELAEPAEVADEVEEAEAAELAEPAELADEVEEAEDAELAEPAELADEVEEAEAAELAEPAEVADEVEEAELAEPEEVADKVEEAEVAEPAEVADEVEEAEAAELAEPAELADEVEEAEEAEVAELAEPAEVADEVEDAEAAELAEPAEVADEVEEAEAAELAEPAEVADEVEKAETAELAEPAEVADEVEEAEAAELAEPAELADEVEEAEDAELAEPAELADEVEEAEAAEQAEPAELADEVEEAEVAELAEPAEPADEVEEAEVAELAEPAELADEVEEAEMAESAEVACEVKPCKEIHSFENECAGFDSDGKLSDTVEIGSNDGFEIADLDFSDLDKEENSTLPENPVAAESAKSVESAEQTLETVTESSDSCGEKNENFLQDSKVILEKAEKKKTGRGLLAVASALANLNAKNILKTENSMNQQRFLTRKASDELLKFRKESAVKSGRDFDGTLLNTGFDSFSFTQFAANNQAVSELCMADEPIVDEGNGLFHISERLDTHGVKQNSDFKKLVESVIRL
ncbi:MAG: hypothetical protein PUA64_04175 [Treponema sp.]|nr:hypothetical protein [Treponema sp.]